MIAHELAQFKMRVNIICPGWIESDIGRNTCRRSFDKVRKKIHYLMASCLNWVASQGKQSSVIGAFLASTLTIPDRDLIDGENHWSKDEGCGRMKFVPTIHCGSTQATFLNTEAGLMRWGFQDPDTGRDYFTGYVYKTLYDWDQYFEVSPGLYGLSGEYIKRRTYIPDHQQEWTDLRPV
jgi:hypothetical protein